MTDPEITFICEYYGFKVTFTNNDLEYCIVESRYNCQCEFLDQRKFSRVFIRIFCHKDTFTRILYNWNTRIIDRIFGNDLI
jgi:hypothetical protein